MSAKKVTLKFPESLLQIIDSHALASGKDRNTVVVQALKQMFEATVAQLPSATTETFSQQLKEIPSLKNRIEQLEKTVATLTGQQTTQEQPANIDILPSQYVQIDNFLTLDETRRLLDYVVQQQSAFVSTSTSTDALDYRRSMALYSFPEFSELIIDRLKQVMPTVLTKLNIPSFTPSQIETQLTAHNHGNYYKIHNDNGSPETATRELTYVYYFYREPKAFSGGELRIYDSKIENNFYVAAESSQTVEPRNNSIVLFPSRYLHEVLPVTCPSESFVDSRFTINGWIRRF